MSIRAALFIALGLLSLEARASPALSGKIVLSGHYYGEQDIVEGGGQAALTQLAFGELRVQLGIARLWQDRFSLQLDVRLRLTGEFDFDRKFDPTLTDPRQLASRVTARGYLGGPEYELREVATRLRTSTRTSLVLGRQLITESDSLKLDGARLVIKGGTHWEGSLFAGGYPNPYSRSLLTDYVAPCGAGVSRSAPQVAATMLPPATVAIAASPCQPIGAAAAAGGATVKFTYPRVWGSLALAVTPLAQPAVPAALSGGDAGKSAEGLAPGPIGQPRIFLAWLGMYRITEHIDLFSNLVWDLYGSMGMQLTRLVLLGTAHWLRDNRLTLHLGYTALSSLAIDAYLYNLLYNRQNNVLFKSSSIVENNLALLRTARHEGRGMIELKLVARLRMFVEGRLRYRSLLGGNGDTNSSIFSPSMNLAGDASLAEDVSVGLRDGGSIYNIAASLSYSFISDFRTRNQVIKLSLERSFWRDRLSLALGYYLVFVAEYGQGQRCDASQPFSIGCFGQRNGETHEASVLFILRPSAAFFVLIDYRFSFLHTTIDSAQVNSDLISNTLLLHLEYKL